MKNDEKMLTMKTAKWYKLTLNRLQLAKDIEIKKYDIIMYQLFYGAVVVHVDKLQKNGKVKITFDNPESLALYNQYDQLLQDVQSEFQRGLLTSTELYKKLNAKYLSYISIIDTGEGLLDRSFDDE